MNTSYTFDERLVLRTPRYPLTGLPNETELRSLLDDKAFLEAIYLASPVLYEECMKWKGQQLTDRKAIGKLTRSLGKYFTRMSSRCTPFGLFSGCAVVRWHEGATAVTVNGDTLNRHTRLDMHYLCALSQHLANIPALRNRLQYFPNNSIYTIGDELRYVEYEYVNDQRIHQISSVNASPYLDAVLHAARNGAPIQQLSEALTGPDIPAEDALQFIEHLIDYQLLVSEIEPAITGKEFLHQLITVLNNIDDGKDAVINGIRSTLSEIARLLQQTDACAENDVAQYRRIMQLLNGLDVQYDESRLFQVDAVRQVPGNGVNRALQEQLSAALDVLNKLSAYKEHPNLQTFIRRFTERYEEREMPLLEVLDGETGIGYAGTESRDITPLVDDIVMPRKEKELHYNWGRLETILHKKIMDMYARGQRAIEITEDDLAGLSPSWEDMPASFSVMFRLIGEEGATIYLESAGGSSAANLLGRFAHADPAIHELVCDITAGEQQREPDVVFAEVVHLPESRTGNILLHPVFRDYEIPYLAKSSLGPEQQIALQDLYVTVRQNRVILRSKRLNKEIIPRLSNAHNYANNALPVYRFLCDLQLQGKRSGLVFNWGSLQVQHQFLPRATFQHTILHPASWNFSHQDIKHFAGLEGSALQQALHSFRQQWHLPQNVVLSEGDNDLLIDLEDAFMAGIWLDTVKNRTTFMLREFINDQHLVTDENGRPYVNQLVAVLNRSTASYANRHVINRGEQHPVQRQFAPGSEWVYYKLYCGAKSADKILTQAVKPLSEALQQEGLTDKWFFIRYNDPDFHIRLRFHLTDVNRIGDVINKVYSHLHSFKAAGYIWKMQLEAYSRELERYGSTTIELAESLFCYDSAACADMLDNTWGDEREQVRWLWALRAVDELLECFGFSMHEKHALLVRLGEAFGAEFNMDRSLRLQLNDKYRANKQAIHRIMDKGNEQEYKTLVGILHARSLHIRPIAESINMIQCEGRLEVPVQHLLGSYIHMMINRIAAADARLQEMVIYNLLASHYKSAIARMKLTTVPGYDRSKI